ncbi:AAA family ATPase [Virgibacillus dakarensis]|nr:AAA family ATPase [Virgibacillus dakarensis]
MRAIKLCLTAFGPYLENQAVDFRELGNESIFLITGPTGAGKTTIFDAICYALYGRASGSDRDQDSLRSHFAKMAEPTEVQFRFSLKQKVYEVIRSPKQPRKKDRGDGYTEEPAKAVLYEIVDGNSVLITSRIKEVNETLEERLGFDYEQFRKMVLIPQGEFRKLISENSKEREVILQKIFRTYFYERMTDALKAEAKSLKEKISELDRMMEQEITKISWQYEQIEEADSMEVVAEKIQAEIAYTKKQLDELARKKALQQEALKQAQQKLHEGKSLEEKYVEQEKLKKEQAALQERLPGIIKQKERLNLAKAAQEIIPFENQSNARKKEWQEQKEKLAKQQAKINQLEKEFTETEVAYKEAADREPEREKLKESVKQAKVQLEQVTSFLTLQREAQQINAAKDKYKAQRDRVETKIKQLENEIEKIEIKLNDEQEMTKTFYLKREELEKGKEKVNQLESLFTENNRLVELRKNYQVMQRELDKRKSRLEQLRDRCNCKEEEQKKQYATLMAHHLEDGKACPVCGSLEHPEKARAHETAVSENELEQLKSELQQNEQEYVAFQEKVLVCKSEGQSQRAQVQKLFDSLGNDLTELEQNTIQHAINNWRKILSNLQNDKDNLARQLTILEALKKQRIQYKNDQQKFKQTFDQLSETYQSTANKAVKVEAKLEELAKQLPETINDAANFRNQIEQMKAVLEQELLRWEKIREQYQQSHDRLQKEITILDQQQLFTNNTKQNFDEQYNVFTNAVYRNGFSTIESYQEAKLTPDEQQKMENQLTAHETRREQIRYRLDELARQINEQPRQDIETLEAQVDRKQAEFQQISDKMYALELKQQNDIQTEQNVANQFDQQKQLANEYYSVGELAELANGNNHLKLSFERYVLASFLDEILLQANVRLDRMTDHRYQLMRSGQVAKRGAQSGLDLEVLDHHTGQKRSVKTLSGGEGFKAALCLALGLADVVQAHAGGVQLDTLFIDEGFGTLDEISLQQAIDCLKDLQESNRLLGIISHVPQLKSEIHAKLLITPSHQGSKLAFSFGQHEISKSIVKL